MRISATQKNTLIALYALEQHGRIRPIPSVDLLKMVNRGREAAGELPAYATNFRAGCHTMVENKLIDKYRSQSLQLAFKLTDTGRPLAERYFNEAKS
jgi:hypothetical protein